MNQENTCIVTLVIGKQYQHDFDRFCRARLESYCTRHEYDLKILTSVLRDLPGKKLTWQKTLIPEMPWWREYDQICIMDSDILVANDAPALPVVPAGRIASVPDKLPNQINSGVLIYAPGDVVAECFAEALNDPEPYWDQRVLSRIIRQRRMGVVLDTRFNRQFFIRCTSLPYSLFGRHWFYHALSNKRKMGILHHWLRLVGR